MEENKDVLNNEENISQNEHLEENIADEKEQTAIENTNEQQVNDAPQASEEVKDIISSNTQYNYTESGAILIDNENTTTTTTATPSLDRKTKIKEPMSKKKKTGIVLIAVATIIVIFSAIFFPTFFFYKGKIMVKNIDDFNKVNPNKYYVLSKDLSIDGDLNLNTSSSIDLNGHTLTINGTLTISTDDEKTINIGTKKGSTYISKGIINVKNIVVEAKNANINFISATLVSEDVNINMAKNVTLVNMSANNFVVSNSNIVIKEALAASTSTAQATFNNCPNVDIEGIVTIPTLSINGISKIIMRGTANVNNLILDDVTNAEIFGTANSITGGNKVAMLNGHNCSIYNDINALAIYKPYNQRFEIKNCDKVLFIDKLNTPVDLIIQEEDGKFRAKCAQYTHEGNEIKYQFYLNDEALVLKDENLFDLTELFKSKQAATYSISVKGIGNYNFDTFDNYEDGTILYLDSDMLTKSYRYTLQLGTPTGLLVAKNDISGEVELAFNKVDFADYYKVYVDGITVTINGNDKIKDDSNVIIIPITSYVESLGYHTIRVTANSDSKELTTSKEAMHSYKKTEKLNNAENATAIYMLKNGVYTITVEFKAVENAKLYKLNVNGKIIRFTSNSYTFTTTSLPEQMTIIVEGYDCYESSSESIVTIKPQI